MTDAQSPIQNPLSGEHQGVKAHAQAHFDTYLSRGERISLGELPVSADLYVYGKDAPCILFIPGVGTYAEYYCEYLSKLSSAGYNVLGVDPRGHGHSGGPRGYYHIDQVVTDMQLAVDYLCANFNDSIGVVGCSLGSRLGLALAEADPRIQSLLCHTLFLSEIPPDLWHQIGWQNLSLTSFWMPALPVDLRSFLDIHGLMNEFPLGQYAMSDERMVWSYPISTLNSVYSASSKIMQTDLGMPAAVLIGEQDQVIRSEYIRRLISRTVQKFVFIEVSGEGHMLPLSNSDSMVSETCSWFEKTL